VPALGNFVPKPLFEDFQEHVFEEPEVFFGKQQGKYYTTKYDTVENGLRGHVSEGNPDG
jgi:hypothetical protein